MPRTYPLHSDRALGHGGYRMTGYHDRLLECRCGAIVEEIDGVRYDWLSHRLHPVHLTVIPGGRG